MPKHIFKRLLPSADFFKRDSQLTFALGKNLSEPRLWSLNRHAVSKGVFIGLFCCFLPIPFQMFVAALFALNFKANLPLSVSLVWISNPITMLPFMYAAYYVGSVILGTPISGISINTDFSWLWTEFNHYWKPLLLGSLMNGLVTAFFGYWTIQSAWRWSVKRSWKLRQEKRAAKL